jgi:ubiquinone/menaquinone biosynthesis C-methylase UbiE
MNKRKLGNNGRSLEDGKIWDQYWEREKYRPNRLYDIVARIYRKYIIKRSLNHFIIKYLAPNANVLHAGCGSGQVDTDIADYIFITALDISQKALTIYKQTNKNISRVIQGSIFSIPVRENTYDGIYNLGVMEHFYNEDIDKILKEFHTVLKPCGKIILFWPPEFGLSVMFLSFVKFIFNKFLGKNDLNLHPAEYSLIKSRNQLSEIIKRNGYKLIDYYFGVSDFFTHVVIVGQKLER